MYTLCPKIIGIYANQVFFSKLKNFLMKSHETWKKYGNRFLSQHVQF